MASVPRRIDNATVELEGRKFCAFGIENNISCVPVDDNEDELFKGFYEILRNSGVLSLVPRDFSPAVREPQILDCGYGTGVWIEELMDPDGYPDSVVTGIDIFHRENSDPQELYKLRWNLNDSLETVPKRFWPEPEDFDLINSRFLMDGIVDGRWGPLLAEYKGRLKPGGWLQMAEVQWVFHSRSGQPLPALTAWSTAYYAGLRAMQKKPDIAPNLDRFVRFAGFQKQLEEVHDIPLESWRREDERDEGPVTMIRYVLGILSSFTIIPFTQVPGLSPQSRRAVVHAAQEELRARNVDVFFRLTVAYGQRP